MTDKFHIPTPHKEGDTESMAKGGFEHKNAWGLASMLTCQYADDNTSSGDSSIHVRYTHLEAGGCIADKAIVRRAADGVVAFCCRRDAIRCSPHSRTAGIRANCKLLPWRAQLHCAIVQHILEPPLRIAI